MQLATHHNADARRAAHEPLHYPALDTVTRPTVDTAQAAHYLNRSSQTLRQWSCRDDGPLRPVRIHGRLAWPVSDIRRLMGA